VAGSFSIPLTPSIVYGGTRVELLELLKRLPQDFKEVREVVWLYSCIIILVVISVRTDILTRLYRIKPVSCVALTVIPINKIEEIRLESRAPVWDWRAVDRNLE
jgi:hypothetical protein